VPARQIDPARMLEPAPGSYVRKRLDSIETPQQQAA